MPSTTEMDLGNEAFFTGLEMLKMGRWSTTTKVLPVKSAGFTKKNWTSRCRFYGIRDHHQSPHLEVDGSQGGEVYTLVLLLAMKHMQQTLPNWIDPTPGDCPRVNMGWFEHRVRKNKLITDNFLH
jgi:hypothetical protein